MANALSQDLRLRILEAYDEGQMAEDVAKAFRVHPNTVRRYVRLRDALGHIEPAGHGGGQPRVLNAEDLEAIRRYQREKPDAYIREYVERLAEERGKRVSVPTVGRALRELGLTRKKNTSRQPSRTVR